MIRALGVSVDFILIFGLALSNGLIALAGSVLAQYQGFADVQMGIGMVVWGLASVIIGEALVGSRRIGLLITGAVMGSVLFRLLVAIALRWGLNPNDLKLITAAFVFIALIAPALLRKLKPAAQPTSAQPDMLEISNLDKTFNPNTPNEVRALRNVSLRLERGSFLLIIGTNGSGKSTLLNAVAGTFIADAGRITLAGRRHHPLARTPSGKTDRPRVSEPVQRHGTEHVHRGKPRHGCPPRPSAGFRVGVESEVARGIPRPHPLPEHGT